MPALSPNMPLTQADPVLLVENQLAPGRYRFQLVVIDTAGLESAPADMIVTVDAPPPSPPSGPFRPVLRPDLIGRMIDRTIVRPFRRPIG